MRKRRLMTPGPTEVPENSLLTLARQVTHHRTPEFEALFRRVVTGLQRIFRTDGDVLLLAGSGTAAMEAALSNVVDRGETILVLASGKFSERWGEMGKVFGARVLTHSVPWGEPFDPGEVAKILRKNPEISAVFGTLSETSTGVCHDVEGLGKAIRDHSDALFVVDGISGVGADRLEMDAWGVDLLAVGSQKALMGIPGAAFVAIGERGWKKIEKTPPKGFYFDLRKYRKSAVNSTTPFTPPKSILDALAVNIDALNAEGIDNVWRRTEALAEKVRTGIRGLGLKIAAKRPANSMTAVFFPTPETNEGKPFDAPRFMATMENRFGVKFAGGQGEWKGKIFRMAHFGIIDEFDVLGVLGAIKIALAEAGYQKIPSSL